MFKISLESNMAINGGLLVDELITYAKTFLHLKQLDGKNSHHIIEGSFKAFARALKKATSIDEKNKDEIPSSKGVLG